MNRTVFAIALLAMCRLHGAPFRIEATADREDCRYKCGEEAVFTVKITDEGKEPTNRSVKVTLDNFGTHVFQERMVDVSGETVFSVKGTLDKPGILRLKVCDPAAPRDGYYSIGIGNVCRAVCYEPEKIRLEDARPADFDAYWDGERKRLADTVPMDARLEPVPECSTNGFNCWRVSAATFGGRRVQGIVVEPQVPGVYPMHVRVPGAGPAYSVDGVPRMPGVVNVMLNVFSHPATVTKEESRKLYPGDAYFAKVPKTREDMWFHDVMLGMDRLIDWLALRRNVDRKRVLYSGGSQGGAYGLMLLGMNKSFTRGYVWIPALGDQLGTLHGRQASAPAMLERVASRDTRRVADIMRYYDTVNFAARIRVPVRVFMGLADTVCVPYAIWAAYNAMPSADKAVRCGAQMGHGMTREARKEFDDWLFAGDGSEAAPKTNILPNPEFDDPVPDQTWKIGDRQGQTLRQETAAMSREWIIRTSGKSYQFIRAVPPEFEPDTDYTLELRARSFGGDAAIHVLELYRRDSDGKVREGAHIADRMPVTREFRTYNLPFRTTNEGKPFMIAFYKWRPREAEDCGLDVASVRLFKGKVEALTIRRIDRSGRKAAVTPGLPIPPNPYGRRRDALKVLVFVRDLRFVREVQEVFAGLNVSADVLVTTGSDQDIYLGDCDQDDIETRLAEGRYSAFCVMERTGAMIGSIMAKRIAAAIRAGAGLYGAHDANRGHLAALFSEAAPRPIGANHPFAMMFPGNIGRDVAAFDPAKNLGEGRYGSGRVLFDLRARPGDFKFMMRPALYGKTDFPFSAFADPALAWLLYHAAGRDAGSGKTAPDRVMWNSADATGMLRASGSAPDAAAAIAAARIQATASGGHAVALRSVDRDGFTIDWTASYFTQPGPTLAVEAVRASCDGDEPAVFRTSTEGCANNATVDWTLADFSGRILERGSSSPGAMIEVPTRSLYTNMGFLRFVLRENGKARAAARTEIYARDRDFARLYDDFSVGVWGQRSACSRDAYALIDRRLEDVGVRWQCMPVQAGNRYNFPASMANGMSASGGYLGSSPCFVARKLDGRNIRSTYGAINTAKAREQIANVARMTGKEAVPYGVVGYTVCDEPNLAERFTPDEPDEEPENVAEFRLRMARKYGTIAEYNRRHRTRHKAFDEIGPVRIVDARATENFAEYVEWRNFNVDRWCEVLKTMSDNGKAVDPRLKMSLFNSFGQTAASGNDYWKLLTKAGLDFSNEYTAMVSMRRDPLYNFDEFYRSFRPDMRVWGFIGYGMDGPKVAFAPWWFATHRYGGLTWFSTLGWGYNLLDLPSLALTRDAADLKAALADSRLMDGLGKLMLAYDWLPRQAAIYYSHDSLLVSTLLGKERMSYAVDASGPLHDYMYSRQGAQYLLEDMLYQHDFVAPEQVVAGALAKRRILFMPRIIAMSDAEVAAVKAFVRAGGKVVADVMPGEYDELGLRRRANPFSDGEIEVVGRNFDDRDRAQRVAMSRRLEAAHVAPVLSSPGIEDVFGREAMSFSDGTNFIYAVIRMPTRSDDETSQTFSFANTGHVYDIRAGKYLGWTNRVAATVPRAGASVWSVLPYKVDSLRVDVPGSVVPGSDLTADLSVDLDGKGFPGTHVFHVEVVPPGGECRFHMKRNLSAPGGRAHLVFRMAANDPAGEWTLRVYDSLTGCRAERRFKVASSDVTKSERLSVVLPPAPRAKAVDVAGAEFVKYYEQITGAKPVSIGATAAPGSFVVRIGVPDADMTFDAERDSYRIRSGNGGITLVGGNPRSTLYAVYDFLERRGGCRWFWDGDVVPRRDRMDFDGLDVYEVSRFDYRAIQYFAHRGLVRFEAEGWGLAQWKREIDWCVKSRLNFFMLQIGMDDIFQKAFPDVVPYPDSSKTEWCDSKNGFDKRSPFWPLEFRGRLRKTVLDYARARGLMHPAKFGTQTHWFSRTPKAFLDKMNPDFLVQTTGGMAERSGLVWDVRQKRWEDAYWRLTEAEIESYGYDGLLFTPGFDERMCSTNRTENLAIKKRFNRLFIDEAYRRYPNAKVLIEGWDLYVGWWPHEIREFLSELDPQRTVIWDYSADATRLSRNLPLEEQNEINDITHWGIRGRFPYVFGIMMAYDHATDIRANYPLIRERMAKMANDPMCKGISLWPETSHSDILALRYLAENFWRPSGRATEVMLHDFCMDRYGPQAERLEGIWRDVLPISTLADWRRILPLELSEIIEHWNSENDRESFARVFYGDFANGVPQVLRKAPDVFKALAEIRWEGDFVRRDATDLARTVADRFLVRAGRELVRLYRACKDGRPSVAELRRKAETYVALGEVFAQLLALHSDFSLAESLDSIDAIEKIRNPEFEKVFFQNTGGTWYCRSHQYEFAREAYVELMRFVASTLVRRAEAGDFSALPQRSETNPYARMALEEHPIRSRRPNIARTPDNWRRTLSRLSRLSSDFLR